MASSRDTSNGPDWQDVATALLSFQEFDNAAVTVSFYAQMKGKSPEIVMTAITMPVQTENGEAKHSVSASVTCSATGSKSLESAVLALLYRLDFALAANAAKHVLD